MVDTNLEPNTDRWLASVGFKFNPFAFLDAATDPYVSAYLISNPSFAVLWGDWPTLVLAPAGGGKTALRVQVSRACWAGSDTAHPFPISYVPTLDLSGRFPTTESEHLVAILRAGVQSLLAAIFFRPHWWPTLDRETQRIIRGLLEYGLPMPLWSYTTQLEDLGTLAPLTPGLGPTGVILAEPEPARWLPLCAELIATGAGHIPLDPKERVEMLLSVLTNALGMTSVYLLVDGIDGFIETLTDEQAAISLLSPLLAITEALVSHHLLLKAFLPSEIANQLGQAYPNLLAQLKNVEVRWTAPSLADIVRQRVYIATEGTCGSLDAICAPSLRDTETRLARVVSPLPREILMLTARMVWERASRRDNTKQLEITDLEAAAAWYQRQQVIA
jgi:hypothetical protein